MSQPRPSEGEAVAEGAPHLGVRDQDRETLAELLATLLIEMLAEQPEPPTGRWPT